MLTLPPVLVAVIVKVVILVKEVGVPEITPVDESIDSPEISDDGETVQETTSPPAYCWRPVVMAESIVNTNGLALYELLKKEYVIDNYSNIN